MRRPEPPPDPFTTMSTATTTRDSAASNAPRTRAHSLKSDLSALTKPRITLMVVLTALVGYWVATPMFDWLLLLHTLVGTALLSTGSSVLNQVVEIRTDSQMRRTAGRPLPAGRMKPKTALVLGLLVSVLGGLQLWFWVNPLTAILGVATLILYVAIYTPMKRVSSLSTLIGAVPGAMPPMMGCTAASGELTALSWVLFGILFFWQMPHFLAIAWLYRADYERGGFPMLPVGDLNGRRTWSQMVFYAAALLPVSVLPSVIGFTRVSYFLGALVSGLMFLWYSYDFGRSKDVKSARRLLLASVVYLPVVLILMVIDRAAS